MKKRVVGGSFREIYRHGSWVIENCPENLAILHKIGQWLAWIFPSEKPKLLVTSMRDPRPKEAGWASQEIAFWANKVKGLQSVV